ncbi:MAG: hypothetical protein KKC75_08210 [Nanoarchaeota archaeon]|nr:hypothetical protein [Nanoarchaeota archaeon]MBU1005705.1 hypothetical protein [Nanoarchaeota archaeon]MBU1946425.1 hypothetical protein [Nanoarchaeota archaeon]
MKKTILASIGALTASLPLALADYGGMMGYGSGYSMMGGLGTGLFGLLWVVLAAFIFSIIFWSTYKWIAKEEKNKRR